MHSGLRSCGSTALLVSVASASEAAMALEGGAALIDAKDPSSGALGRVDPLVLADIAATVGERAIVTAALGDARDIHRIERLAAEYAGRGAAFVKVGFAGTTDVRRVDALLAAAVRGCAFGNPESCVVAVAYADAWTAGSIDAISLVDIAARSGARGVLVDTADKRGDGLTALWEPAEIASWVAEAHTWGLIAAVAGRIGPGDLAIARDAGADIVGVRGAACVGGRTGEVSADLVRFLRAALDGGTATAGLASAGSSAGSSAARGAV